MKRILVTSVNWLGDVVFSTPVYRALKEHFPGVKVVVLAVPRVKDVLAMCPDIDEVIVYDEEGADRPLVDKARMALRLRAYRFDTVFFLRPSFSRALLACAAGIPLRIGFRTKNLFNVVNHPVDDAGLDDIHRADVYLTLLERYGLPVRERSCRLSLKDAQREIADRLLNARGIGPGNTYCVLNTGGNWDLKQWPWDRFAALARLISEDKGLKIVFTGGPQDTGRVSRIVMTLGTSAVDLTGATDLPVLAAVFVRARCVISADSGPLHLASAMGVRTVAIFGPTRPEITGPRGTGRSSILFCDVGCNKAPCYYLECPDNRCMKAVEVADVVKAVRAC
ncbi:MAG: lipopolysaccharide heptosyltransferase II [Candidatus Omnitrophica bacterium]|nr:lipopolysaccharide heptosyltransferase II [Candidatus Omnitrophota bacterium]